MSNLRLNRQQLAQFLPNHESIKAFEQLFSNVYETTPTDLESVQFSADNAAIQAAEALGRLSEIANALSLALYGAYSENMQPDLFTPNVEQQTFDFYIPPIVLNKSEIGLGNVDNTSDANKPVSTAQATAIAAKLTAASNLSDLTNAATARNNLGLSTLQSTTGTIGVLNNTPITFATLPGSTNGAYLVCCDLPSGAPATYSAVALITSDAGVLRQTDLQTAIRTIITISGLNLQVNQTSGATQTVSYTVLRIS